MIKVTCGRCGYKFSISDNKLASLYLGSKIKCLKAEKYFNSLRKIENAIAKITIADGDNLKKHQEVIQEIVEILEEVLY